MELDAMICRHFTKQLINSDLTVYDLFKWKRVDVRLKNYKTGEIITDMPDLEFPEHYSQSAADIVASKYFRKKGVNN
jgi:ribonucleoside-diphosphate reductase alpha chain